MDRVVDRRFPLYAPVYNTAHDRSAGNPIPSCRSQRWTCRKRVCISEWDVLIRKTTTRVISAWDAFERISG